MLINADADHHDLVSARAAAEGFNRLIDKGQVTVNALVQLSSNLLSAQNGQHLLNAELRC